MNFLKGFEKEIIDKYTEQGYIIAPVDNHKALSWIRKFIVKTSKDELNIDNKVSDEDFLNSIHTKLSVDELNSFRLKLLKKISQSSEFRFNYYQVVKAYLDIIVGNELSMQLKINLSIQLPSDDSSLLPIHADTWSGDSPFEVVAWIPLVDCYKTKSMYILPPKDSAILSENFPELSNYTSENMYSKISDQVDRLEVKYGDFIVFNQTLPHGNIINSENETRWTMNCRFKSVFSPYNDKKLGEFFEPITLRPASKTGLNYKLPNMKKI